MVDSTSRPSDLRLAEAVAYVYGFAPKDEQPRPSDIRAARAIAQALLNAGIGSGGGGGGSIPNTDALPEGINNLYFTPLRAQDALTNTLQNYALASHNQPISSVTGLQNALDAKTPYGHDHGISDVTGLQNALDEKSPTIHDHEITNINGLQTALDNLEANDLDNTNELPEGTTNLYYTNARADARADTRIEAQKGQANGLVPLRNDLTISSEYITLVLENIAALLAVPKPVNNSKVAYVVKGYYTSNDGGGGVFYWDENDTTTPMDSGLVFQVNNNTAFGRWKRVFSGGFVNAKWFGLREGTGVITHASANSDAIQAAINTPYNVVIPIGNYTINKGIRCSAGYFNSIGRSPYFGNGKVLRGEGLVRLYAWTGNVPVLDFTGSSGVTIENLSINNLGTTAIGTAEGSNNASALGITMCRDALTDYVHYNIIRKVGIYLADNNSNQLGGLGTLGLFCLGTEHIHISDCTIQAILPAVFTRFYQPYYTQFRATGLSTWRIQDYLPNFSNPAFSSCHLGRVEQCIFISDCYRHPILLMEGAENWTFDNIYLSNRPGMAGSTLGTWQYCIFNALAFNCRFQGQGELAGQVSSVKFRRTGFMRSLYQYYGWDVNFQCEYSYDASNFAGNVPQLLIDWDGSSVTGINNSRFKITVRDSATNVAGNPVDKSSNVTTGAHAANLIVQNCEFTMDTSAGDADIIANLIRIKNVKCYEGKLLPTNTVFSSRHWEDYNVWAYGVVSNTGAKDTNRTTPRIGTTSLSSTTYTVNFGQALTAGYYTVQLTIQGATTALVPVLVSSGLSSFTYQVYNASNAAVTTGFTNVHFAIHQVCLDSNFN